MRNLSKSEKFLIGILLFMIVGYIYYQYIITPVSKKIQAVQSRVDSYQQQLLNAKLMEASNKKMNENMGALKEKYDKYIKLMPKSDMSAEVTRDLNSLAVNNKVTLTSLTVGNGVEYKASGDNSNANAAADQKKDAQAGAVKIMSIPITINIKGDYSSFTAYLNSLENSSRVVNINSVNVTKQGVNAADTQLSVSLSANVLYVQDGTQAQNNYEFNNGSYSKDNPFK